MFDCPHCKKLAEAAKSLAICAFCLVLIGGGEPHVEEHVSPTQAISAKAPVSTSSTATRGYYLLPHR
jgi:hypothetical protein